MKNTILFSLTLDEFKDILKESISEMTLAKQSPKDNRSEESFLTQRQAAKYLQITEPTIIKWKKENRIPYYQNGRRILYKKSELLQALRKNNHLIEN